MESAMIGDTAGEPLPFRFMDLSAELRNRIYAILFEHPDPVYIVQGSARGRKDDKRAALHRRIGDRNESLFNPYQNSKAFWHIFNRIPAAFVGVSQTGMAMFRVSRTVHSEAASVFYKNNTFALSRTFTCHSASHDTNGKFIGVVLKQWFDFIGSNANLLSNLIIDLDTLCPKGCQRNNGSNRATIWKLMDEDIIDLIDLLRILWCRMVPLKIVFVHTTNAANQKIFPDHGNWHHLEDRRPNLDLEGMGDLVDSLQRDDLNIKQFQRLIGAILVKRNASGGTIIYSAPKESQGDRRRFQYEKHISLPYTGFFTAQCGGNVCMENPVAPVFKHLPAHLQDSIITRSFELHNSPRVDIANVEGGLATFTQRHVNHRWLKLFRTAAARCPEFAIVNRGESHVAEVQDPSKLKRLVQYLATLPVDVPVRRYRVEYANISLVFKFQTTGITNLTLQDVSFSATPLLEPTLMKHVSKITIELENLEGFYTTNELTANSLLDQIQQDWQNIKLTSRPGLDETSLPKEPDSRDVMYHYWYDNSGMRTEIIPQGVPQFWFYGTGKLFRVERGRRQTGQETEISVV